MSASSGKDLFLTQIATLCETDPTRAKWIFVPGRGTGRMQADGLVLRSVQWANLRIVTPLDIAVRMGAPFLVERGIDPSEEALGAALIMRLLLNLPSTYSYFRPLAKHPAMAQALWSTIRELRIAGIGPTDVSEAGFTSSDKHAEFQALHRSYEDYLRTNNRGDMASVYEEAMKHFDWCSVRAEDCWLELPNTIWTPLQRQLLDKLPGERLKPMGQSVIGARIQADVRIVAPGYFETMKIKLLAGRFLDERDAEVGPRTSVINETMARRYFPNESPLGRVIQNPHGKSEVVGVVGDVHNQGLANDPKKQVYLPLKQSPTAGMALVARTDRDASTFGNAIQRAIWEVDPQRTREIGLRMALGASGGNTVAMIVRSSVGMVAIGGVIGLVAATFLARSMAGILYGVGPFDLPSFAAAAFTLLLAGVLASVLPALRTTRVDPVVALRDN